MSARVILYDLPSKGRCACWSLNPWKTRLVLNFKGIDYETQWLEYPDIGPKFNQMGVKPNPKAPLYTIPTLSLPASDSSTTQKAAVMQDSLVIAKALEEAYPNPSLRVSDPMTQRVQTAVTHFFDALRPAALPLVPSHLLNPPSQEYWAHTRTTLFELADKEKAHPTAWEDARAGLVEVRDLLRENEGDFFLGDRVAYADFVFVGALKILSRIDEVAGTAFFEGVVGFDEGFRRVWGGCEEWLVRDDY